MTLLVVAQYYQSITIDLYSPNQVRRKCFKFNHQIYQDLQASFKFFNEVKDQQHNKHMQFSYLARIEKICSELKKP